MVMVCMVYIASFCSPPARWGLLDFMSDARLLALVLLPRPSSFLLPPSSFLVLPRHLVLPRPSSSFLVLPRPSSSSPDLICQLLIAVGLAGVHLPALDRSEPRRISSASSWSQWASQDHNRSAVGLAGLQPARVGAPWALPDFNRRGSERWGPRRTWTAEGRSAVGVGGV